MSIMFSVEGQGLDLPDVDENSVDLSDFDELKNGLLLDEDLPDDEEEHADQDLVWEGVLLAVGFRLIDSGSPSKDAGGIVQC